MPPEVLKKHGIVSRDGELVNLQLPKLTLEKKLVIRQLCEEKMQNFIESRGLAIWNHRLVETQPVPNSVRYQVLKSANGKCMLCGALASDAVLHVDHIVPRSEGGTNDIESLQRLCEQCNLSKSNRDDLASSTSSCQHWKSHLDSSIRGRNSRCRNCGSRSKTNCRNLKLNEW